MRKLSLTFLLLSFLLTSCHPLFCVWDWGYEPIKQEIGPAALVGTYVLDNHSRDQMKYEGNYKVSRHTLQLFSDSTFKVTNFPDWTLNPFGESDRKFLNLDGKWKVICDKEYGCRITFSPTGNPFDADVETKKNQIAILFNVGDPDGCIGMVYLKAK